MLKLSRRNFLKTLIGAPALSFSQSASATADGIKSSEYSGLFVNDFTWQCRDPFASSYEDEFYSDQYSWNSDVWDETPLEFDTSCQKSFLVRRIVYAGQDTSEPSLDDLEKLIGTTENKLTSFSCPNCNRGWWMGRVAVNFDDTFCFSEGQNRGDILSPIKAYPPAGIRAYVVPKKHLARIYIPHDRDLSETEAAQLWRTFNDGQQNADAFHIALTKLS